uniref:Uracil phosphoribosyltransferase n=1 Tax=Symphyocladiella dendroidea TaxID=2506487 RepID=A0A1Z1M823_9FLOR|nr:uracil phosphoribosyltransferase [Symphyocladiella dendroidea]ARW61981.1 uracil phosphoribosyltransferase [Symphyocladiella dendroidea]
MKLNIYKISHPIIKTLLAHLHLNKKEQHYKYIGFLFIYEIFRKYIETNKIYIKQIKNINIIHVINKKKKYFILTNISNTYDIISDTKEILPEINIINIDYQSTDKIEESLKNLKIDVKISKILIIEKVTNNDKIINLITYLKDKKNLHSKDINIGCIISNEETLNKMGNHYPELKVYTTTIIYKNK